METVLTPADTSRIAERLMSSFCDVLDTLREKNKIKEMHRAVMEKYKSEIYSGIEKFASGNKYSHAIYDILEDQNYHFLNEALTDMGFYLHLPPKSRMVPRAHKSVTQALETALYWANADPKIYPATHPERMQGLGNAQHILDQLKGVA